MTPQNKEQTAEEMSEVITKELKEKVRHETEIWKNCHPKEAEIIQKFSDKIWFELGLEFRLKEALSLKEQDTIKKLTTECNNCVMMLKQQGKQELWDDIMRCRTCNGDVTWKVLHTLSLKHKLIAKTYDDLKQKRHNLK